jgi:transposase InsO family protein
MELREQHNLGPRRIQTNRGREFFAIDVQEKLMEYSIKFKPNKPGSPHLNGKVKRSQRTDLEEFYATADLSGFEKLQEELGCGQFFYNWQRPHGSLNGRTPSQAQSELSTKIPFWDEVIDQYDPSKEHIQEPNYYIEMTLRKLKQCL